MPVHVSCLMKRIQLDFQSLNFLLSHNKAHVSNPEIVLVWQPWFLKQEEPTGHVTTAVLPEWARFPAQSGNTGCSALQSVLPDWAGNLATLSRRATTAATNQQCDGMVELTFSNLITRVLMSFLPVRKKRIQAERPNDITCWRRKPHWPFNASDPRVLAPRI